MNNTNYTNLKNTYLYSHKDRGNNYFQNYKNFANDIEDPIFTGFTLSIDYISSPLFYGDYEINDGLLGKIENNLEQVWKDLSNDRYDIRSLIVRNKFDNGADIGYGLMEDVYSEELLYGATDYIYMVDKKEDTPTGGGTSSADDMVNSGAVSTRGDDEIPEIDNDILTPDEKNDIIRKKTEELADAKKKLKELEGQDYRKASDEIRKLYNEKTTEIDNFKEKWNEARTKAEIFKSDLRIIQGEVVDRILVNGPVMSTMIEEILDRFNALIDDMSDEDMFLTPRTNEIDSLTGEALLVRKQNIAHTWFNKKGMGRDIPNSCADVLDRIMNVNDNTQKQEDNFYDARQSLDTVINDFDVYDKYKDVLENLSGMTLKSAYDHLTTHPSEYDKQQEIVDNITRELNVLKGRETGDGDTSTSETDEVTPKVETPVSISTENSYRVSSGNLPNTVLDMVGFTMGMRRLCEEYPYTFLSVTGLDNAYQKYHKVKDSYYGSGDDTISIDCLDTLDMKVSSTFNKYLNAVYDRQYRRERVPMNLRRFNCSIFVHDIRNFREALSRMGDRFSIGKNGDNTPNKIVELALNYMSVVEFKFFECEIVPEETGGIFDNVTNTDDGEWRHTKFTFKYGNCVVNFLPFADLYQNYTNGGSEKRDPAIETKSIRNDERGHVYSDKSYRDGIDSLKFDEVNAEYDYRRYWDESELGNVYNDDYKDYIVKSHPTVANDFIHNRYGEFFVNNSVGKIQQASTKLDDILHRTVLGIAASVGESVTSVADAMGVGYLNNVWNKKPVDAVGDMGNVNMVSSQGTGSTPSDVNGVTDSPVGITKDLGGENMSVPDKGISDNLGNSDVNPLPDEITNGIGNDNPSPDSTDKTEEIGHNDGDGYHTGITDDIGDTTGDVNCGDETDDLKNLNDNTDYSGVTGDIDNLDMSGDMTGVLDNVGNVDVTGDMTGSTGEIGNMNYHTDHTGISGNVGNLDMSGNPTGNTDDIGVTDVTGDSTGNTDGIGLVDVTGDSTGKTDNIGITDVTGDSTGNTDGIGLVDVTGISTGNTDGIGLVDVTGISTGNTGGIGLVDVTGTPDGMTSDIGITDIHSLQSGETSSLGNYDVGVEISSSLKNLGRTDVTGVTSERTKDVGHVDVTGETGERTSSLGNYDLSGQSTGNTDSLGRHDFSSTSSERTENIGITDVTGKSSGRTKDIGNYNVSGKMTGRTDSIGEFDLKGKEVSRTNFLGQNDKNIRNDDKTSNLGKYGYSTEYSDSSSGLGKTQTETTLSNVTGNIGKYDLSGDINGRTESLGRTITDEKTSGRTDEIGDINVKSSGLDVTSDLGGQTYDTDSSGRTDILGKYTTSGDDNGKMESLGMSEVTTESRKESPELGDVVQKTKSGGKTSSMGNTTRPNPGTFKYNNLGNVFRK